MDGIVACGNCHFARDDKGQLLRDRGLSGGMLFNEPPFKAYASNITPDKATGIGKWTDAQLKKAIREGVRPDGSVIGPPMPIEFYRHLSDRDLSAIVAYLRAQPAVRNEVPKSVYNMPLPPSYGPPVKNVNAPPASDKVRYGEYLANIGHCMECHTPRSDKGELLRDRLGAGGMVFEGPWGKSVSRNLTPHESGLKGWTDAQIAKAIRDRRRPQRPSVPAADGVRLLQEHQRRRHGGADRLPALAEAGGLGRQELTGAPRAPRVTCTACRRAGRESTSRPGPSRCPGSSTRAPRPAWRRR